MGTNWLTSEDRELIDNYLAKPAHERRIDDLVPDAEEPSDRSDPATGPRR